MNTETVGLMRATNSISIENGFAAKNGSFFVAKIETMDNCNGNPNAGGESNGGSGVDEGDYFLISNNNINGLRLYPNPTQKNITVEYEIINETVTNIDIINTIGERVTVLLTDWKEYKGKVKHELQLPVIDSGLYVLRILNSNKSFFAKFIILN